MGKHQYDNEPSYRKQNYSQHDDRAGPAIRGGGGGRPSINRVWRKGDGKSGPNQAGQSKRSGRHVSFNDRSGGGISRGGIHKRLRGGPTGSGALRKFAGSLDDDDASMRPSGSQAGRARPAYVAGRGGRGPRRGMRGGRGGGLSGGVFVRRNDTSEWHKVTLLNASRYPKEEVLTALVGAHAAVAPLCFSKNGMNYVFYVEARQQANALSALDKQIRLQDGSALNIRADPSPPPTMVINDDAIEKIKTVMSQRYNPANKALDMKSFHSDRSFLGESVYAPLSRALCMKKVVQIINENIPEVEAIDFSDNRMQDMSTFAAAYSSRAIKILYLANNKLENIKDLVCLKDFEVLEILKVDGNPFVSKYVDHEHLSRNMRKIFPSLKILNDKEMPKVIGFEGDDEEASGGMTPLPPVQMKMTCNQTVEPVILQFLQEYFKVYDSGNREPLMNAYHEEAVMSLHANYLSTGRRRTEGDNNELGEYFARSRNIIRLSDPIKRRSFLKTGRLAITSFISELPKTEHDFNSFTLDVPLADSDAGLMQFTVTGVFKETEQSTSPVIRHFSRTFLVVPQGNGFCIVNETLFVTNSTVLSMQKAFTGESAAASTAASSATGSSGDQPDASTIMSMVNMMAQKSGMNEEWSKRCLQETNWNLEAAFEAFQRASNEGKIPITAYEK